MGKGRLSDMIPSSNEVVKVTRGDELTDSDTRPSSFYVSRCEPQMQVTCT
jgi:hypothetical protein